MNACPFINKIDFFQPSRTFSSLPRAKTSNTPLKKLPSNEDYSKILKKLELVINNTNYGQKLLTLSAESPLNIYLEKGNTQYIHIFPQGNLSPLSIKIKKVYGKIKTYISKKIAEPCEEIHDEKTNDNLITVYDKKYEFGNIRVALGIKAIIESNINVTVKYGSGHFKNKSSDRNYRLYSRPRDLLEQDSLDEKIRNEKMISKLRLETKTAVPRNTVKSITDRSQVHSRRKINYARSKMNYQNIKKYKLALLEKTRSRTHDPTRVNMKYSDNKKRLVKIIVSIACLVTVFNTFHHKLQNKKKYLISKIISFQQLYRTWTGRLSSNTTLERARMNLKLYRHNILQIHQKSISKGLKKFFHLAYTQGKVLKKFSDFRLKSIL
jgi:hypothetical protein